MVGLIALSGERRFLSIILSTLLADDCGLDSVPVGGATLAGGIGAGPTGPP